MKANKKVQNLDWLTEDTFMCADFHFGHKSILEFELCRATAMRIDGHEDHTEWLVENYNSVVGKDDTVLMLGDVFFSGIDKIAPRLNGKKYLILGNHDKRSTCAYNMFDGVISGELLIDYNDDMLHLLNPEDPLFSACIKNINGTEMLFSHYALYNDDDWDRQNKKIQPRIDKLEEFYDSFSCEKNVHGHLHSNKSTFKDSINVSIEHLDFAPKRLRDLL